MTVQIASLYAKIGADVSDFQRGMASVKKDMDHSKGAMDKFGAAIGGGLKVAAGVGIAAFGVLATGIGAATKSAMSMEQQIANIRATMNLTAAQTETLKGLIKDLGLDPKLKVSAVEAAQAIEMLGKNGLTMDQIMSGAAKSAVLLANATNDNFAMAADVATDVMQQFNLGASQMSAAVDGIIGVTQASKFGLEDYALAIAQAGGVAGAVGVSFDDFNAVIAATSSSFASGSDAGTSFKTFLQRLEPDTEKAREVMGDLGLLTVESGNAFFDASGKMKSMAEIAGLLQQATASLSEQQKIAAFSTLFGTDAMRTAFAIAEAGSGTIQQLKGTIGNVSAEQAAATRMDTLRGSWEVFTGVLETLSISIGEAFLPAARAIVEWATRMAQQYGPLVVEWAQRFGAAIATLLNKFSSLVMAYEDGDGMIARLLQTLGVSEEVAMKVGQAYFDLKDKFDVVSQGVINLIRPITSAIAKFVSWKDVLLAFGALLGGWVLAAIGSFVVSMAPVLAIIAAAIAAVAAMRWAWQTDWMGIRTTLVNSLSRMGQAILEATGRWEGNWGDTIEELTKHGGQKLKFLFMYNIPAWIKEMAINGINYVKNWYNGVVAWWQELIAAAKHYFGTMGLEIKNKWNEWIDHVSYKIEQWVTVNLSTIRRYRDWVIYYMNEIKEWFSEKWQAILEFFHVQEWVDRGRDLIQGFWDGIKTKWGEFKSWAGTTFEGWKDWFNRTFDFGSPSGWMRQRGQWLGEGLKLGIKDSMPDVYAATAAATGVAVSRNTTQTVTYNNTFPITLNGATGRAGDDLRTSVQYLHALYGSA